MKFLSFFDKARRPEKPSVRGGVFRAVALKISGQMKSGVTLVELLVVMVVMVIVVSAALSLFHMASRHEARQQEMVIQLQNLRAALYTVGRDARMAGSGMTLAGASNYHIFVGGALADPETQEGDGWFAYAGEDEARVVRVMGTDSGSLTPTGSETANDPTRADTLTILRFDVETPTEVGRLSGPFTPGGDNQINLRANVVEGEDIDDGDMVAVANGNIAVIVQARLASPGGSVGFLRIGDRFRPDATLPANYSFPDGSYVYNLRDVVFVTYYVDTANNRLMANYHDATISDQDAEDPANPHLVTIAENIEDFQVQYFLEGNAVPVSAADIDINSPVVALRLAMVSRARGFSDIGAEDTGSVEIFDHKVTDEKGFSRRILFETIQLRNP